MSGVSSNVNAGVSQGFVECCLQLTMSIMRDEPAHYSNQETGHTYLRVPRNAVNIVLDGASADSDEDGKSSICTRRSSYRSIAQLGKQQIPFSETLGHSFHIVQNLVRT